MTKIPSINLTYVITPMGSAVYYLVKNKRAGSRGPYLLLQLYKVMYKL